MTQQPNAGWYNDPDDARQVRWWNGISWSDQRMPQKPPPTFSAPPTDSEPNRKSYVPMEYIPMATPEQGSYGQAPTTRKEKDRELRKNNSLAYTGLVLSLIAFLINPFGVVSVLGIVFSSIGFSKATELQASGYSISGRGTAKAGIIIGILGLAAFAYFAFQ